MGNLRELLAGRSGPDRARIIKSRIGPEDISKGVIFRDGRFIEGNIKNKRIRKYDVPGFGGLFLVEQVTTTASRKDTQYLLEYASDDDEPSYCGDSVRTSYPLYDTPRESVVNGRKDLADSLRQHNRLLEEDKDWCGKDKLEIISHNTTAIDFLDKNEELGEYTEEP